MNAPRDDGTELIGVIILAAGYSKRFPGDKRQARWRGKSLLESTLAQVPRSFGYRLLVLHPGDEPLADRLDADWHICIADQAARGIAHSLRAGVTNLLSLTDRSTLRGMLIGLGDMPFVRAETYARLGQLLLMHEIVAPLCEGLRGNPVGFGPRYFDKLTTLTGDRGARDLLIAEQAAVHLYETEDRGVLQDIDTKEALASLTEADR